jgi:adenylate cyclase
MSKEIERKFLVVDSTWKSTARRIDVVQGYLSNDQERSVRIRIAAKHAFITIKGPLRGFRRSEFEYSIPLDDAEQMLSELCVKPLIIKTRYEVEVGDQKWEIDVFDAHLRGIIIAELELPTEEHPFERPSWLGAEVTDDHRYYNENLAKTGRLDNS